MGKLTISIDESVEYLLKKYVDEVNSNVISEENKYTLESAANALLARILANKYPII